MAASPEQPRASSPGQLAAGLGFVRSLAIYYGQPWRVASLRRHYARFLGPGDLAFDIGAHVGSKTRCFAKLGARVIALEPQPAFATWLRWQFKAAPGVTVVESAVAATAGIAALHPSARTPTVASLSPSWIAAASATAGFERVRWQAPRAVTTTTLDALIARFGLPRFCKIDVEGYEAEVVAGLSQPIPALSLEYLPHAHDVARAAIAHLAGLGAYRFNVTSGERRQFLWDRWRSAAATGAWLAGLDPDHGSGDLYARLDS